MSSGQRATLGTQIKLAQAELCRVPPPERDTNWRVASAMLREARGHLHEPSQSGITQAYETFHQALVYQVQATARLSVHPTRRVK